MSEYNGFIHAGRDELQQVMILEPIEFQGGDGGGMIFEAEQMKEIPGDVEKVDEAIA